MHTQKHRKCFNNYHFYFSFRNMEDFVTWVDSSKIKQHVLNYNEEVSFLGRLLFNFKAAFYLVFGVNY